MALTSRITGLFGRVWNSLGSTQEFESDEEAGLWMTGDAQHSFESAAEPPSLEFVPPSRPIPRAAPEATIEDTERPEAPVIAFQTRREAMTVVAPELEPVAVESEPAASEPATAASESAPAAAEPGPAPAATADLFEAEAASTQTVAAGDDGIGDALSMFREVSTGSDFQHFTKDIEDIPAQELLTEARAILDLLGGPVAATE